MQYVGARDARAKQAIATDLADVGDFVADRRNLVDGRRKPLLQVGRIAQAVTRLLLNVRREEQRRNLAKIEVIDDAQRFRSAARALRLRVSRSRSFSGRVSRILRAAASPNRVV